jgi:ABC-type cobalt transport system substrate-binding protein
MRVGQTYVDTFVLSFNHMSSYVDASFNSALFSMHPPLSPKFSVIYTPESGEVKKVQHSNLVIYSTDFLFRINLLKSRYY